MAMLLPTFGVGGGKYSNYHWVDILPLIVMGQWYMRPHSTAFDLLDHYFLVNKFVDITLPRHIVRWMAAFLTELPQRVDTYVLWSKYHH